MDKFILGPGEKPLVRPKDFEGSVSNQDKLTITTPYLGSLEKLCLSAKGSGHSSAVTNERANLDESAVEKPTVVLRSFT
jgi:hypothetical protein